MVFDAFSDERDIRDERNVATVPVFSVLNVAPVVKVPPPLVRQHGQVFIKRDACADFITSNVITTY
jgi:hypothetical protein